MAKKKKKPQNKKPAVAAVKASPEISPEEAPKEKLFDSVSVCTGLGATIGGALGLVTSFVLNIPRYDIACLIGLVAGAGLGAMYHSKFRR